MSQKPIASAKPIKAWSWPTNTVRSDASVARLRFVATTDSAGLALREQFTQSVEAYDVEGTPAAQPLKNDGLFHRGIDV